MNLLLTCDCILENQRSLTSLILAPAPRYLKSYSTQHVYNPPPIMILFSIFILYSIFFFSSLICFRCASSFAIPPTHHIHNTYPSTKLNNDLQDEIERKARQRAYEKRSQGGGTGETVGGAVSLVYI